MTLDLDHLEQLERAATPGPWHVRVGDIGLHHRIEEHDAGALLTSQIGKIENAELIVAARNAFPSLIADLRRERERNAELEREADLVDLNQQPCSERSRRLLDIAKRERKWARSMEYERDGYFEQLDVAHDENERLRTANAELAKLIRDEAMPLAAEVTFYQPNTTHPFNQRGNALIEHATEVLRRHGGEER